MLMLGKIRFNLFARFRLVLKMSQPILGNLLQLVHRFLDVHFVTIAHMLDSTTLGNQLICVAGLD